MANAKIASGTVTGTGAAINVSIGFSPRAVILINQTDPGMFFWTNDMDDAEALKLTDAVALTFPTSDGISAYAGSSSASPGFTIGADSDLNAEDDVLSYIAFGED